MKALKKRLEAEGVDVSTLQPLYEAGEERGFRLRVTADAEGVWRRLRGLVEATGFWPVILGDREEMERVAEEAGDKSWGPTAELIERSLAESGEQFLSGAFEEFLSYRQ